MEKKYFTCIRRVIVVTACLVYASAQAMVYDNRYLPLLQKILVKKADARGQIMLQPFAWIGEHSFFEDFDSEQQGASSNGGNIPLFNINGLYSQTGLERALLYTGGISQTQLRSDFAQSYRRFIWEMDGIIRGQGIGFTFYQPFTRYFSWGFNFFFAHLRTSLHLKPKTEDFGTISDGDFIDIINANNKLQDILQLNARSYSTVGISDIEWYVRCGIVEDYKFRMRHFDVGCNFGVLIPSAQKVNYFNPAAIPLGGNGHWGIFASLDGQFELKENLGVGLLLRLNKRFSQRTNRRMVQLEEPDNYGVLYGPSEVDPGVTVIFSPYGQLLRLRSGFGLQAQYTLVYHEHDDWKDLRRSGQPPANTEVLERRSEWASEYVNVAAIYDFSKDSKERTFKPIITCAVDVPVQFLITKRVAKTFGISLTVESTLW